MSLDTRFNSETLEKLKRFENFVMGKENSDVIINFYNNHITESSSLPFSNPDFNEQRLILHQQIFFEILNQRKVQVQNLNDVVIYLQKNPEIGELVSEFKKLIKIILTIPSTTCMNERAFSGLRYLKSHLRSTMTQKRLNNVANLYIHKNITQNLDIEKLMDEFILRNSFRSFTFALRKK